MHTCVGGFDVGGAFEGVALLSSQAFAMVRALFFLVLSNTSHPCCDECALVASMLVPCTSFLFFGTQLFVPPTSAYLYQAAVHTNAHKKTRGVV